MTVDARSRKTKLMGYISLTILILAVSFASSAESMSMIQTSSSAPSGKLAGLVLNAGEARVPAARVIIEAKGFRREVTSDDEGNYEIELPAGKYKIHAERDEFYPSKKKSVRVNSNSTTKFDIILKVGRVVDDLHP